jgi:hypothetical protein
LYAEIFRPTANRKFVRGVTPEVIRFFGCLSRGHLELIF